MTCKDCLGNMFCSKQDKKKRVDKYCADANEVYKSFKDKSRFIALLCGVGDTLYEADFEFGVLKDIVNDIQIVKDRNNELLIVYKLYCYSQNGDEPAKFMWATDVTKDCFGKMIFFTKEEAEAKLKEWNEDEQFKLYYDSIVNNEH